MNELRDRDFRAIVDFVRKLYAPADLDEFRDRLLDAIRQLIPCDLATYDEMNPAVHTSVDRGNPTGAFPPEVSRRWQRVMHEHPVLMHCQQNGDLHAYPISYFYSERQFHGLALYHEYYKKISVEDALCKGIRVSGPVVIGCGLHRSRRSFRTRDRLVYDLVGPHMTQAWRNARDWSRIRQQLGLLGETLEALDWGIVSLRPDARVRHMPLRARILLEEFFGSEAVTDHQLPGVLNAWVRQQLKEFGTNCVPKPLLPFTVKRDGSCLMARLLTSPSENLLLFQKQHGPCQESSLATLGLTRREAQVLAWVAQGKTNGETASILGVSPRTVQKHLERIFIKLGVETRTAAAHVALKTAGFP